MIVLIFLIISPALSVGLSCSDPNRQLTYREPESNSLCFTIIDERCANDYNLNRAVFGMANPYNYRFNEKLRSRAISEGSFCDLVINSTGNTIHCYCSSDYCSTHFENINKLWKGSDNYDPNEKSSKCLHMLSSANTNFSEGGIICPKCGNVSLKLWDKKDRCKVVLDCNKATAQDEFEAPRFDVSHMRFSDIRGRSYCFVNSNTTIICVCDTDFCTGDPKVVQELWKKSDGYKAGSTLDQCMQKFLEDLPNTVKRPPKEEIIPEETEEPMSSDAAKSNRNCLVCVSAVFLVYLASSLFL